MPTLKLISHYLCPYVQRARIVLQEKAVPHDLQFIDLADKPDWFLAISPLGKVPVLLVDGRPLFESAAIAEYLDETTPGSLHPGDRFEKARHRAWIAFASSTLDNIAGFYNAADPAAWERQRRALADKFQQVEATVATGPFFAGTTFSLVDAAFAPVFRYFEVFEGIRDFGFFRSTPAVAAWRSALAARSSVRAAVVHDYHQRLQAFLANRRSHLSALMDASQAA
jgi:glutathione S-transferase